MLRVVMCGSRSPIFSRHLSATVRAQATSSAYVSALYGRSQFSCSGVRLQETGLERPTPRGSKPTRS
ncbi:hypothetical protein ASD97_35145 [Streptomyces sp. Root63]|nr:hypothetical protein ASD97_35145 [Streptomyces sp. Root63]